MSTRRSKFEIYVDVLTQIKNGINLPTRIMYSTHLSWDPLCQLLKSLIVKGLIEERSVDLSNKRTKRTYSITDKGNNILMCFNNAKNLMKLESALIF